MSALVRKTLLVGLLLCWIVLAAQPLHAQTQSGSASGSAPVTAKAAVKDDREARLRFAEPRGQADPPSTAGLLMRSMGALLLVLGIIVTVTWGLRRFGGARFGAPQLEAPELAVLHSISIGERRTLTAVRFGDRMLLLGATAQSITLLADEEIRSPKIVGGRSVAELLDDKETPSFRQILAGG